MDRAEALLVATLVLIAAALAAPPSGITASITKTGTASDTGAWPSDISVIPEQPYEGEEVVLGLAPVEPLAVISWDFGDGKEVTGRIVSRIFGRGTHKVRATVTVCKSVFCESRTFEKEIEVI